MRRVRSLTAASVVLVVVAVVAWLAQPPQPPPAAGAPPSPETAKCRGPAGADEQPKTVRGPVTYIDRNITVSNVVFVGTHRDDLVRVYGGRVLFVNVTFLGRGSSSSGHSLEVKRGGAVEVYNSKWAGAPSEDSVQFNGHEDSLIMCSLFESSPGEDHVDIKPTDGAVLDIVGNDFRTAVPGAGVQNLGTGGTENFIDNTIETDNVFYESGSGVIRDNDIHNLQIYSTQDILVVSNTVAHIKHGEWGSDRIPDDVTYRDNWVGSFEFNGGSCLAYGNQGPAEFDPCD